ncbi:MAG: hypothetical protein RLZZ298_2896 [Pseudomonadota bacterium]|jgi:poly-gamma-glutamate synthesis protein (capsule biosynthesis protein)
MSRKLWSTVTLALGLSLNVVAEPVNLIFTGDIMLDDGPGRFIGEGGDPLLPFSGILKEADYRIGNLECPIATSGTQLDNKIYNFRAKPRVLPVLQGRFDALSLANNHSGDYGHEAFLETMHHLEQTGIHYFGGGRNLAEAHKPLWIERKGLKIAVLAYNEFKPRSFEAGADHPGVAWSEDSQVIADIRAAKAAGADLVIPYMHWGWEKEDKPSARQRQLAHKMIDEGAAVVVGSHPHVTQGAETYKGKPIIYSLGNFVFDGFDYAAGKRGWLLRLKLDKSGVIFWDTLVAQMDDNGTPTPISGSFTPCGKGGDEMVSECLNP